MSRLPGDRCKQTRDARSVVKSRPAIYSRMGTAKFCFKCDDFPCTNLAHLDKRYRTKYQMSMIENLENIEKHGIRKFIENEKLRWACPKCEGTINVHKSICANCGAKPSSQ